MPPTFGKKVLMLSASDSLLVTLLVAISNSSGCRWAGRCPTALAAGRCPIAMTLLALATAWPALTMLANAPELLMMLERAAVAVVYLRHAQRGDDPGADRKLCPPKCAWQVSAGLQPGDRGVWRLHAGDFTALIECIPVIKRLRLLDELCRHLRPAGHLLPLSP
ncbi:hypothetical protein LNQ03_32240 [Klebsiella pneumoniae subsp. pneumoniae]|nr:hypothetical protein [Klebsiella pneumoniae subsp. pneumoniae]